MNRQVYWLNCASHLEQTASMIMMMTLLLKDVFIAQFLKVTIQEIMRGILYLLQSLMSSGVPFAKSETSEN